MHRVLWFACGATSFAFVPYLALGNVTKAVVYGVFAVLIGGAAIAVERWA